MRFLQFKYCERDKLLLLFFVVIRGVFIFFYLYLFMSLWRRAKRRERRIILTKENAADCIIITTTMILYTAHMRRHSIIRRNNTFFPDSSRWYNSFPRRRFEWCFFFLSVKSIAIDAITLCRSWAESWLIQHVPYKTVEYSCLSRSADTVWFFNSEEEDLPIFFN